VHTESLLREIGNDEIGAQCGGVCMQVSKLPPDVRDGRAAPQDMEQEALKRSPGWQLYHKWTFRLELAQQVRRQLRDTLGGCNGVSVLGDIPKAYGSKRQEKTLRTETSQL